MSKGGGEKERTVVQKTSDDPWGPQQEPLKRVFEEAGNVYDSGAPKYYEGSGVVDYSPQTEQSLDMIENRALQGSDITRSGQNQMQQTLDGNYLSGNPFFQGAFEAQVRPAVEQYTQQIAPRIDSNFNAAGRLGSNAYATARNTADDTFARAIADTGGKLAYQNYGMERGLQNAAAFQAPQYAETEYDDALRLAQVGGARETKQGEYLQDDMNRWNFNENAGWNRLGKYAALVAGGDFGGTGTSSQPVFKNTASGILGGAGAGAKIGNMIVPGGGGAGIGALAGGLLGAWG
jgi:hypothetical protein